MLNLLSSEFRTEESSVEARETKIINEDVVKFMGTFGNLNYNGGDTQTWIETTKQE